jgi:SpoVK/Ycf46/Vps4 family AAA+-type ATPase
MRKGRFDEVFFVDLPSESARRKIFEIHLRRRKREPGKFKLDEIAKATEEFSGSEIEQLIVSAMYTAFAQEQELADEHILAERQTTRPLAMLMRERIDYLRDWAKDRCVPAD